MGGWVWGGGYHYRRLRAGQRDRLELFSKHGVLTPQVIKAVIAESRRLKLKTLSLQELCVSVFHLEDFTAPLADALWAALASLPHLDAVVFEISDSGVGDWVPLFLNSVTLMTRLR